MTEQSRTQQCPHCGRSFDTRLVDINRHAESCKQYLHDVLQRNLERIERGKRPTRTGF